MQVLVELPAARRFVRELLKCSRGEKVASLDLVMAHSSCSKELAENLLSELDIPTRDGIIRLSRESRLDLAISEADRGFLLDASRFLEWQDFERFAEHCMSELGFETKRDIRFRARERNWQIDVTGIKGKLLVCLDCKHWAPPMSPSRFKNPETHQAGATELYALRLAKERSSEIVSLPVLLTLFEPHQSFLEKAVIVGIQRLPSLLRDLTPYTPGLPFVTVNPESGENPISHGISDLTSQ